MMYCTRKHDPQRCGVVVTACVEAAPPGAGRFRCFDVFVSDNTLQRGDAGTLDRAEAFAKAKLQEALDADNPRHQPNGPA